MKTISAYYAINKLARLIPLISILLFSSFTLAAEFFDDFENVNVTMVETFELTHNGITATVVGGTAFTIGKGTLYHSGKVSWMVEPAGINGRGTHTGEGTINFSEPMSRISFWVRKDPGITLATVTLLDVDGNIAENSPITTVISAAWTNIDFTIINGAAPLESILFEVFGSDPDMAAIDDLGGTSINVNVLPTADAGPDQVVNEGDLVNLDGSASADPDGTIAAFSWTQTDASGITATLTGATTATPSFTAPAVTTDTVLTFSLIVTDNDGGISVADSVDVTVNNVNGLPTANAGPNQVVNEGDLVNLDGTASSDPDGSIATFSWTQTDATGITATLTGATTATPSFTAPAVTTDTVLTFSLIVTDNDGRISVADSVNVNVNEDTGSDNVVSGGGSSISIYLLLALGIVWAIRRRYPLQF